MPEIELPSYFEYMKNEMNESGSGLLPFFYDSRKREFHIGETTKKLSEFDPYKYIPDIDAADETDIPIDDIHEYSLMIPTISGVIGGPRLHGWTAKNPEKTQEAIDIMHDAFTSMIDKEFAKEIKNEPAGFMGFDGVIREGGAISLQVFGSCACLNVSQDGLFIHDGLEKAFGQYELHNADSQAQRVSLYAGIGHLARLASSE